MKNGDRVRHKLLGQYMYIVHINETIAACRLEEMEMVTIMGVQVENHSAICTLANLEPAEIPSPQLKMF